MTIARASATRVAYICVKASAATAPLTPQKRAARRANAIPFRVDLSMEEKVVGSRLGKSSSRTVLIY